jgi:hypothetical protein
MTLPNAEPKLYARVEGGAIYTLDENDRFLVILNQTALYDLLDQSDIDDIGEPAEKVWSFDTSADRDQFLAQRFKSVRRDEHL